MNGKYRPGRLALPRKDTRSIKKQLNAANLTLTDRRATKFWPVYEQYSAKFRPNLASSRYATGGESSRQIGENGRLLEVI